MLLDDIAAYLDTNSTKFLVGSTGNLFKGIMLDDTVPDTVTVLYELTGLPPLHVFSTGATVRDHERPSLDVLCRSTDYQTARNNADTVFTLLDSIDNSTLSGTWYRSVRAIGSPAYVNRDESERFIIGVSFDVEKSTG